MLTIISMIVGFISSLAPDLLKRWQDSSDKKHELAVMELQMKADANNASYRMDEIGVQEYGEIVQSAQREQTAMIEKSSQWVIDFSACVRPVITYLFVISFIGFKMAAMASLMNPTLPWHQTLNFTQAMLIVWGEEETAIFAGILAYWFGDRGMLKRRGA